MSLDHRPITHLINTHWHFDRADGYHRDLRRLARLRALLDLVIERLASQPP